MPFYKWVCLLAYTLFTAPLHAQTKTYDSTTIASLKKEALSIVSTKEKPIQEMIDMIFSFGELGFQEVETSHYLTDILSKNGFTIEKGISHIPTAWFATWGSGSPVIALGSDIDCIPKASQKPGIAYKDPIVEGAPGHGEGHNSGQSVIIFAALAVKELMQKYHMPGTIIIWPGVAEELLGSKAWYIRDGYFKNIDACIFTHVSSEFAANYGDNGFNGLVSVKFSFEGDAAHAAGAPWRGKSALDAVELMDVGWNFKREHLKPTQRSHYVITDGGDQPNVVPSKASVWYYFRERNYEDIKSMYDAGIHMAQGASLMTDTKMSYQLLGTAWPGHFNKALAETFYANIKAVGMPQWSAEDNQLALGVQKLLDGAVAELESHGIVRERITVVLVPGAWELPLACRRLAEAGGHHAVIALGCVIRGETPHFDYVCAEAARGITDAAAATGVPVAFGVVTANTLEQAEARSGGAHGNKGNEAADAAVEMAELMRTLPRRR